MLKHGLDFLMKQKTNPISNQQNRIVNFFSQTLNKNFVLDLELWRQWFADNEFLTNSYLWRNKTITNDTLFDHRILLEAYQRGAYVGSLESLPNDCFSVQKNSIISIFVMNIFRLRSQKLIKSKLNPFIK